MIVRVQGPENVCSLSEFLTAEDEIPICAEFDDITWDEEFMAELGPEGKRMHQDADEDEEDEDHEDVEPSPPRLKNFKEAMECLEDVRSFLELHGHMTEATKAEGLVNNVAWLQCATTRYTEQQRLQATSSLNHQHPPLAHHPSLVL